MATIFFDMDGVLCDFYGTFDNYAERGVWSKEAFTKFVEDRGFSQLEPTAGFHLFKMYILNLLDDGHNVQILSSMGALKGFDTEIKSQKTEWLLDYGLGMLKRNFVFTKGMKEMFAAPDCILLDDLECNISDFRNAGGHTVHVRTPCLVGAVDAVRESDFVLMALGGEYY